MSRFRLNLLCIFVGILALLLPRRAAAQPWQSWLLTLAQAGYTIEQGSAKVTTVSYCKNYIVPLFHTCFNSDASDPYVIPLVPVGAGYVDPYFGLVSATTLPNGTVVGQDYRLGQNEAVLLIVTLPPLAGYFSYQNYLFTRLIADYKNQNHGYLSPDPTRNVLYATYGNSINNTNIAQQSGLTLGAGQVAIISTANSALISDVTQRFAAVGGNTALLFPDPMGRNINFGLGSDADDFSILLRYLVPQSTAAGRNWLESAATNVRVFRLTEPASLAITPYPTDRLRPRAYNTDVSAYDADVTELNGIMEAWLATQENKASFAIEVTTPSMTANANGVPTSGSVGPFCIEHGGLCFGDQQDAIHWGGTVGAVAPGQLFILDGVNPASTNNTDVLSMNLEDASRGTGVVAISQTNPSATGFDNRGVLTGSAELALKTLGLWNSASSQLQADSPNLFVHIFTRGCTTGQTYCGSSFVSLVKAGQIPYLDKISLYVRAYALPNSPTGPNPHYVAAPYVIH